MENKVNTKHNQPLCSTWGQEIRDQLTTVLSSTEILCCMEFFIRNPPHFSEFCKTGTPTSLYSA